MKIDPAFVQAVVALAALLAGLYAIVTRPLLKRMDDIRTDLTQFKTEMHTDLREIRGELKLQGERLTRVEERLPPPMVHR